VQDGVDVAGRGGPTVVGGEVGCDELESVARRHAGVGQERADRSFLVE
jgi:hypothetical protein